MLLIAFAVAACDDEITPVTPTPTEPVTVSFPGTLTASGAATRSFTTAAGGAVTATLKTIGADNTLVVGLALGTWNAAASSCSIVLANDAATGAAVLTGTMTAPGALCVRVYDVGNLAAGTSAAFSVEIVHP